MEWLVKGDKLMLEKFKEQLSLIFESNDLSSRINEGDMTIAGESKDKFIHQGSDGKSYSIEVEKSENEFYVFDESISIYLLYFDECLMSFTLTNIKRVFL